MQNCKRIIVQNAELYLASNSMLAMLHSRQKSPYGWVANHQLHCRNTMLKSEIKYRLAVAPLVGYDNFTNYKDGGKKGGGRDS